MRAVAVVAGAGVGYWAYRAARRGSFNEGTTGHAALIAIQVGGMAAAVLTIVFASGR